MGTREAVVRVQWKAQFQAEVQVRMVM
jgi:hypothetical protein